MVAQSLLQVLLIIVSHHALASHFDQLQPLIGTWQGRGNYDRQPVIALRGWTETITWIWHFEKDKRSLRATFVRSPHFTRFDLFNDTNTAELTLLATTTRGNVEKYRGRICATNRQAPTLIVESVNPATNAGQSRIVLTLLHSNRLLYRFETRSGPSRSFIRQYQVGATKDGEPFVGNMKSIPECVVTGGEAKTPVTFQGKTYYVCCSGCRDAFYENPEAILREWALKKGKK